MEVDVSDPSGVSEVSLLYRVVPGGADEQELVVPMLSANKGRYMADIPGQPANRIVRFRIRAVNRKEVKGLFPGTNDIRPALSCLVWTNSPPSATPWGYIIHTDTKLNEAAYLHLTSPTNMQSKQFDTLRDIYRNAIGQRDGFVPDVKAAMSNDQEARERIMRKIMELQGETEQKVNAALSQDQAQELSAWRAENQTRFMGPRRSEAPAPSRGVSAFVYVEAKSGRPQLYDFVSIPERNGGWKVHFGHGQSLHGMTGINLIFESSDRYLLAEPLAYELHRRAGLAACLTDYVRLWVDGEPVGYHLLIEQPNKAFLRRNGLRDDGNLYKATYMGDGIEGQHEKKSNPQTGHVDLVELVRQLEINKTNPVEQWNLIKREFDVEAVVSHYAVRALISDWDGFFNNYYLYHDFNGSKKWSFFPWDEDKTWGDYDGAGPDRLLYDMPLSYGAEGDSPPGWKGKRPPSGFMGPTGDTMWWRPGGWISKPLLANPTFRKLFLARLKELLDSEFNEARLFPLIDQNREKLIEELRFRAKTRNEEAESALSQHKENIESLKNFVTRRREWLLKQPEIKSAGIFDRSQLK